MFVVITTTVNTSPGADQTTTLTETSTIPVITLTETNTGSSFGASSLVSVTPSDTPAKAAISGTTTTNAPTSAASFGGLSFMLVLRTASTSTSQPMTSLTPLTTSSPLSKAYLGSSTNGTVVGLAVGIPVAVVSISLIAVLLWTFLRRKIASKSEDVITYGTGTSEQSKSGSDQSWSSKTRAWNIEQPETPGKKVGFLKRLSKLVHDIPATPVQFRSPMLLRRFHLNSQKSKSPSSIYLTEISTSRFDGALYDVILPYDPRLPDELDLQLGETVKAIKFHADGWVHVARGEREGVVPQVCLSRVSGAEELNKK